jgi:hypothetical protein
VSDELKYSIRLEDGISPAARAASASLRETQKEMGKLRLANGRFATEAQIAHWRANPGSKLGDMPGVPAASAAAEGLAVSMGHAHGSSLLLTVGLIATAEAAIRLGEGLADAGIEVIKFALEVTNTNKQLEATFTALSGSPKAGKATLAMFNELSAMLPQSREQLAEWTKEFNAIGITDIEKVRAHLVATAGAAAIMGESGAAAYIKLEEKARLATETGHGLKLGERPLERLYQAGVNVTDMANKLGVSTKQLRYQLEAGTVNAARFGEALEMTLIEKGKGPLEAMMSSLEVMKRKGLETLGHLFDDIDTKPLTDAIQSVIDLGDQGEPSGQALKKGITGGLNGMMKELAHGITRAEVFFLKLELGAIRSGFSLQKLETDVKDLGSAAATAAIPFVKLFEAGKWLFDHGVDLVGKTAFSIEDSQANIAAKGAADQLTTPDKMPAQLPAHARGGLVTGIVGGRAQVRAAAGEGLASIGPGERIMPARQSRMMGAGIGASFGASIGAGMGGRVMGGNPLAGLTQAMQGRDRGSHGAGVSFGHFEQHVHAAAGVTDAHRISVYALAAALEHSQLHSGR